MRVPSVKTVASAEDVARSLRKAWEVLFEEVPKLESVALLMAQSALETGRWKSCYSWGLGNVKWTPATETDVCYRECNELLTPEAAVAALVKASPRTDGAGLDVELRGVSGDKQIVWFYPDHPASAFRAFKTLDEGAVNYLSVLHKRFSSAWPAVVAGSPLEFVTRLKASRYFTAPLAEYLKAVNSLFLEYLKLLKNMPPDPEPEQQLIITPFSLQNITWSEIEKESHAHGLEENGGQEGVSEEVGGGGGEDQGGES